ncbi:hypothetical protein [Streptomyces sp. AS02]|nr:hypothetical protein [Streptomyces sp. AS02]MCL8011259.1 hypothetical protein [Streptomyces sp. AS02]
MSKVFFITGAGRGMAQAFAREAIAMGLQAVATGGSTEAVRAAVERFVRP